MKRLSSTLALLVVLVALGAYIYFVDAKRPATDTPVKEKVFTVSADAVESLTVKAVDGETTSLKKGDGGAWMVVEPVKADADANDPTSIVSSLSTLELNRVVDENPTSVADFGLEPARIEVSFTAKGEKEPHRLLLGNKTPPGTDLYARRQGDTRVFLVGSFVENTFNRTTFDLRDKRIVKLDRGTVDSIEVTDGKKTLQFVKHGDQEWNIVKPMASRGDFSAIDGLLNSVTGTQVQKFIDGGAASDAEYGFDKPALTMTMAGGGKQTVLTVGKTADGTRYAKDSTRPLVFTIGENFLHDVQKEPTDFRRKDLFDFRPFNTARIEFVRGAETIKVEKSKGKDGQDVWTNGAGKTVDTLKAEDPLMKFSTLKADSFVTDAPAATKTAELTVTAVYDDGKKTEVVRFATSGSDVYAVRQDEPGAAKVPAAVYAEALKAIDALK